MNVRMNEKSHVYDAAYDPRGREIYLPRNGKTFLQAGSYVKEGDSFTSLDRDMFLITTTRKEGVWSMRDDKLVPAEEGAK